MNNILKVILGTIYILCLGITLFFVFSYLDIKDLSNFSYIKENTKILIELKNNNLILFFILFLFASIIWVLLLGFGSPIALVSGFIFGQWYGTFISLAAFTIGSSLLYLLSGYYFNDFITKHLSKKIEKFKNLFNKNELLYFMLFRFTGGGGIPFAIQNILPVVFNMKLKNYIISTFIGLTPIVFIINSLGSNIKRLIGNNEKLSYSLVIQDPGIYLPLICFIGILILSFFIKKKFFTK